MLPLKNILNYYIAVIIVLGVTAFADVAAQNQQHQNPILSRQQHNKAIPKEVLAINFYRAKDYGKAAQLFEQLYKSKHSNNYYNYYFNCLVAIKDYKQADKLVRQHSRLYHNNYRYLIDEAYVADLMDNKKKSNKIFNKILDNLPTQRNEIIHITSSLQTRGYTDEAIKVLQKANKMQNNNSYNLEMANAYLFSGDYNSMFDSYIKQLEQHPEGIQLIKSRLQYVMKIDVNSNLSGMLKKKLLESYQANPGNIQLAEMLLWYSMQTKDFAMALRQAKAIDARFGDLDKDVLELADIAMSNYDYATSASAYEYLKNKKSGTPFLTESYVGYYLSVAKQLEENPNTSIADYKSLERLGKTAINKMGVNNLTSSVVVNMANIIAFKLNNTGEAIDLINKTLDNASISKNNQAHLKLKLADIYVATGKIWDATLLYSQVDTDMKNEPIGHEAKLKNAKVFYYIGEFDWANTQLDVLKSSTSKLISNDAIELSLFISNMREEDTIGFALRKFAKADLYTYQGKYDSALMLLNKVENDPAGSFSIEYALYDKALLYSKQNKFIEADSVYNILISRYPQSIKTDNALFDRAEIQRIHLNNNKEALKLYMILMTNYPESIYSSKARKHYRLISKE